MATPIILEFELYGEKGQSYLYKEVAPGKVVGQIYLSKIAIHFALANVVPQRLRMTIDPIEE